MVRRPRSSHVSHGPWHRCCFVLVGSVVVVVVVVVLVLVVSVSVSVAAIGIAIGNSIGIGIGIAIGNSIAIRTILLSGRNHPCRFCSNATTTTTTTTTTTRKRADAVERCIPGGNRTPARLWLPRSAVACFDTGVAAVVAAVAVVAVAASAIVFVSVSVFVLRRVCHAVSFHIIQQQL